jgi:hypothetical protein
MFKAVQSAKVRLNEDVPLRCADIFKANEDFLTAAVFSRLLYMPTDAIRRLLPVFDVDPGEVVASTFWPQWSVDSGGETSRVEPDIHIRFDGVDLIVEAKLGDVFGYQTAKQWAWEWAAWHQAFGSEREALLLGIGGLGRTDSDAAGVARNLANDASFLLRAQFPGTPPIRAVGLSWQGLYGRLDAVREDVRSRLLADLREILGYFGFRGREFLADLAEVVKLAKALDISVSSIDVFERRPRPRYELDWLAACRRLRPISDVSIAVLAEADYGN